MTRTIVLRPQLLAAALAVALAGALAPAAQAASSGGMVAAAGTPKVSAVKCGTGDRTACPRGYVLRLSGVNLSSTRSVLFLGKRGKRDDRRATPSEKSMHRVIVKVPAGAHTGPLVVVTSAAAAKTPKPLRVLPGTARKPIAAAIALPPGAAVFPIQGPHKYGTGAAAFGGGRGHQGQDVFAKCGTPLVAAIGGTVQMAKWQDRAGNYLVIQADDGTSQAYMHMREPADFERGDKIAAGQPIGHVGDTGHADGCHLHFEFWTAPGWYEGGTPIDPLPILKSWDGQVSSAAATSARTA